jgi:4-hydroxy-2-oxoheptanedioate aldolase
VEKIAECGFDCVLLDAEHGCVSRDRVEDMARAAALAGTAAIIRPEGSQPHLITGYLGCAVDGFMLPLISTPEQAQDLIDTFKFSAPHDHADRILILMIEKLEAVENLPALLRLEGVDAYMVAPADLALTMGETLARGKPMAPRVLDMIDQAIATIVKSGRVCGMRVDFNNMDSYLAKGVTLLYDHADHMMKRGSQEFFARIEASKRRAA